MPVSAEGPVEHQKLNYTAALLSFDWVFGVQLDSLEKTLTTLPGFTFTYTVFLVRWVTFFLVNRVELQKLNQNIAELSFR